MNRLVSVGELRAVAIKHLVKLSVEHEFILPFFFSKRKTCHDNIYITAALGNIEYMKIRHLDFPRYRKKNPKNKQIKHPQKIETSRQNFDPFTPHFYIVKLGFTGI